MLEECNLEKSKKGSVVLSLPPFVQKQNIRVGTNWKSHITIQELIYHLAPRVRDRTEEPPESLQLAIESREIMVARAPCAVRSSDGGGPSDFRSRCGGNIN